MWVRQPAESQQFVRPLATSGAGAPLAGRGRGVRVALLALAATSLFVLPGCVVPGGFCRDDCARPILAASHLHLIGGRPHVGHRLCRPAEHGWAHRTSEFGFSRTYWHRFPDEYPIESPLSEELPLRPTDELGSPSDLESPDLESPELERTAPPTDLAPPQPASPSDEEVVEPHVEDPPDLMDLLDLLPSADEQGSRESDHAVSRLVRAAKRPQSGPTLASVSDELHDSAGWDDLEEVEELAEPAVIRPVVRPVSRSVEPSAAKAGRPWPSASSSARSVDTSLSASSPRLSVARQVTPGISAPANQVHESSSALPVSHRSRFRQPSAQPAGLFGGWLR